MIDVKCQIFCTLTRRRRANVVDVFSENGPANNQNRWSVVHNPNKKKGTNAGQYLRSL